MSKIIRMIVCIAGLLGIVVVAQAQGWRGILPLRSTRVEVERLIGPPMQPNGITYDLKSERVNVVYSDGGCTKDQPSEWNVPLGTVIAITVYPQTKVMLSDLRSDLGRFEKFINPHNPDSVSYKNDEEGMGIGARSNGEVVVIHYFPAAKDRHLRCPNYSANVLSNDEMQYYKFDQYSNLSDSDQKARLDNFATYLQRTEPALKGYIIVYTGPRARLGEAKMRAERAKEHLVRMRGINAERVVPIDGGCRALLEVELYALPKSMSPLTSKAHCPK